MWISRARYEQLVASAAEVEILRAQYGALLGQVEHERHRAENAVDALLLARNAPAITPQVAQGVPDIGMFDDDPEELKRIMREMQTDPNGTLIREGVGDATDA